MHVFQQQPAVPNLTCVGWFGNELGVGGKWEMGKENTNVYGRENYAIVLPAHGYTLILRPCGRSMSGAGQRRTIGELTRVKHYNWRRGIILVVGVRKGGFESVLLRTTTLCKKLCIQVAFPPYEAATSSGNYCNSSSSSVNCLVELRSSFVGLDCRCNTKSGRIFTGMSGGLRCCRWKCDAVGWGAP